MSEDYSARLAQFVVCSRCQGDGVIKGKHELAVVAIILIVMRVRIFNDPPFPCHCSPPVRDVMIHGSARLVWMIVGEIRLWWRIRLRRRGTHIAGPAEQHMAHGPSWRIDRRNRIADQFLLLLRSLRHTQLGQPHQFRAFSNNRDNRPINCSKTLG